MKNILVKSFTREFPLVHVQMWGRRYALTFLGERLPRIPLYFFVLKAKLVTAYRNVEWGTVNEIIKEKIRADKDFIDKFVSDKASVLDYLLGLEHKKDITNTEFISYLDSLFDYWQLHYIAQFLPLDEERFSESDREKALNLRRTVDRNITDFWNSMTPILKKLNPTLGDLVVYISWDEIKNSKIPTITELEARAKNGVEVFDGEIVNKEKLDSLKKELNFELSEGVSITHANEIRGQVACHGMARGRVKKVLREEDIKNFIEGEVLVSYMTMPAFTPAMRKAVAFITDEGGITSHAAIVAREMNKPCIIGTHVATQVLQDGDMVELDGNNGIVRML